VIVIVVVKNDDGHCRHHHHHLVIVVMNLYIFLRYAVTMDAVKSSFTFMNELDNDRFHSSPECGLLKRKNNVTKNN
jgi:hypothetical protein